MKKELREALDQILKNQDLIIKHLNIKKHDEIVSKPIAKSKSKKSKAGKKK